MNCFDPICLFCRDLLKYPNELKFGADLTHQIIYHIIFFWNFLNFSSICFEFFTDREQLSPGSRMNYRSLTAYLLGVG